jgi:DNA-binding transcriptional LysR family regulator
MLVLAPRHPLASGRPTRRQLVAVPWLLGPSATDHGGATAQLLRRFQVPEVQQRIFQSHAAALAEARDGHGIGIAPEFGIREALTTGRLRPVSAAGATAQAMWEATTLPADQAPPVATELARFVTTPRAIQSMLSGAGANVGRFRPRVHVTLWS